MNRFFTLVASIAIILGGSVSEASQALKKAVTGSACMKTSGLNPVWSFKPDKNATDGDFYLKWGKNSNQSQTTGVCPNRPAFVFVNVAGCTNSQGLLEKCPFYLSSSMFFAMLSSNQYGNVVIPLNGQLLLNYGGNAAFQVFVVDTQGCQPSTTGIIEIHASPLCTLYDMNASPVYSCN